jgi:hypothetical protein
MIVALQKILPFLSPTFLGQSLYTNHLTIIGISYKKVACYFSYILKLALIRSHPK